MTTLRVLEREFAFADLSAVNSQLAKLSDEDVFVRMGLQERKQEIEELINQLEKAPQETAASAALFFGGRPVIASRGIESEFGGKIVAEFQDLVSKIFAQDTDGLGQRGVVANKAATALHITNIVRGSFGFLLEEVSQQASVVDTQLKTAVDSATKLLTAFGNEDIAAFRETAEEYEDRVLDTVKEFFRFLRKEGATFRLVSGEADKSFGETAIELAIARAETTTTEEKNEEIRGKLWGVFPDAHQFEFQREDDATTIRGKVAKDIAATELLNLNRTLVNLQSTATFKVRRLIEGGQVVRQSYTLLSIERV